MLTDIQLNEIRAILKVEPANRLRVGAAIAGFAFLLAGIIAALNPAATQGLPFGLALMHWVLHIVGAAAIFIAIAAVALRLGLPLLWATAVAVLGLPLGLAPLSLAVEAGLAKIMGVPAGAPDGLLEELGRVALPSIGLVSLAAFIAIKSAGFVIRHRRRLQAHFAKEPALRSVFPSLPHELGEDLISVSANDHYVHVRTTLGTTMLGGRFADCVERLKPFAGLQVHRSHWVRQKHVLRLAPKGSSYICILSDGTQIPVSRRRHAELKRLLQT